MHFLIDCQRSVPSQMITLGTFPFSVGSFSELVAFWCWSYRDFTRVHMSCDLPQPASALVALASAKSSSDQSNGFQPGVHAEPWGPPLGPQERSLSRWLVFSNRWRVRGPETWSRNQSPSLYPVAGVSKPVRIHCTPSANWPLCWEWGKASESR